MRKLLIDMDDRRAPVNRVALTLVLVAMSGSAVPAGAEERVAASFYSEPDGGRPPYVGPKPPSFEGKVVVRDASGGLTPRALPFPRLGPSIAAFPPTPGGDQYLQDGSETSVAINPGNGNNLIGVYNEGWNFDPDIPHSNSTDGNVSWTSRSFPNGSGTFTGPPFDPWANHGNAAGVFFSTEIRRDAGVSGNAHVVVSRSTDSGASFSLFFEQAKAVFQDREMVDVDRTTARGGGSGTAHDDKLYLGYDDWGAGGAGYVGSFLQVVASAGSGLTEIHVSGTGSPPFRGSQLQPVAGTTDGTLYMLSGGIGGSPSGSTHFAFFHEVTNGGAGPNTFTKSTLSWAASGQQLGTSTRFGLNGHRIDDNGSLDIDRSSGPRRGNLYLISNRNPNPGNSALDQGDVHLSVSTDGASSWSTAVVPTAAGKTQYFPMMDVDDQGWIHVAYYQNDTGSVNGGVLNAKSANIYYVDSADGGSSWSTPVQVNATANELDFEDPPPDRAGISYYLIGDYAQIQATGTGASTKAYVLWTGYDKDRSNSSVGDKKQRVLCTTLSGVGPPAMVPALSAIGSVLLGLALLWSGKLAARVTAASARGLAVGPKQLVVRRP